MARLSGREMFGERARERKRRREDKERARRWSERCTYIASVAPERVMSRWKREERRKQKRGRAREKKRERVRERQTETTSVASYAMGGTVFMGWWGGGSHRLWHVEIYGHGCLCVHCIWK